MEQRLREALSRRQKRRIVDASRTPSAVIVPIYYKEGQYYILFTKRTDRVKYHKGQISFPGGAYHESDGTLLTTALRECREEIGLEVEAVNILGELDDAVTQTSNYVISPFVALIPPSYPFKVNHREIEEIIEVPISALTDRGSQCEETRVVRGEVVTGHFYHYQGRVIWGATAQMLKQFLDIYAQALG